MITNEEASMTIHFVIVLATITLTIKHGNSYVFDLHINPTKISTENMAAEISVC